MMYGYNFVDFLVQTQIIHKCFNYVLSHNGILFCLIFNSCFHFVKTNTLLHLNRRGILLSVSHN